MWEQVSVIIPAFNEEKRLESTLESLTRVYEPYELIGINDGSSDKTGQILEKYCSVVLHLPVNQGKGTALKAGWEKAMGEIILCLDADLGASVIEADRLIEPLEYPFIDGVIGRLPAHRKGGFGLVKKRAQQYIFEQTGQWFSAPLSGQRSFRRKWLDVLLEKTYVGYGVETAMTIDLVKNGALLIETDVHMYHRELGRGIKGFFHRGKQYVDLLKTIRSGNG